MRRSIQTIVGAFLLTFAVLVLGYALLGLLPMFLFAFGFLGGFIIWLLIPVNTNFSLLKVPFFLTLAFFIVHKWEERYMDFFPALSKITGVPVPEVDSVGVYLLYAAAGAWLLIPFRIGRAYQFGYYLAWTFFTSMGVTELAHFVLPLFTNEPYGYFPGMASVIVLAPSAWWGMWRLKRESP